MFLGRAVVSPGIESTGCQMFHVLRTRLSIYPFCHHPSQDADVAYMNKVELEAKVDGPE